MIYLIEILLEFIMEIGLELLFTLGSRRIVDVFKHPIVASIVFGSISGLVSLIFINELLITNIYLRVSNLLITPIILGSLLSVLGQYYNKLGLSHSNLDSFSTGFSFAMAMSLVRFAFGQ